MKKIFRLETPAVIVDRRLMEKNADRVDDMIRGTSMRLFPHYKSHKCVDIARWQMARGAGGITCAKLSEAADLVRAGIPRVVLANQVIQPSKIRKLAHLAGQARLTVCADNADNLRALSQACVGAGTVLGILIEYEVGMQRCGVDSPEAFLELARLASSLPALNFEGIQAYAGQLSHETDAEKRHSEMQRIEKKVAELKHFLEENGVPVKEVCGGSTGTVADKPKNTVYTQLQTGSYLFMDASYGKLKLPFEQSMFILTSVISVSPGRAVLDCGAKSLPMDQEPPYLAEYPALPLSFNEEHTIVFGEDLPFKRGDMLRLVPGHCCTTNNCFSKLVVTEDDTVWRTLPVTSRGRAQ